MGRCRGGFTDLASVTYPNTDIPLRYVPNTRPYYPPDRVMAGFGSKSGRKIDDIDRLRKKYKKNGAEVNPKKWKKEKAQFEVYDLDGNIRTVEIHWYSHEDIGRVEFKRKYNGGRFYVDEWY